MSCYPILTPYPGTRIWDDYLQAGRIIDHNWDRYNGASVVYAPRRMSPKQLRHAQMAAFAEFYTPRSALHRLGVWPIKSRSWLANLAIWRGIRYYYNRAGRRVPRFADFLTPDSPAWNYKDADGRSAVSAANALAANDTLAVAMVQASDPLVQSARRLQTDRSHSHRPIPAGR